MASSYPINTCIRWGESRCYPRSTLAYSVEILLHELCARLILQELHLLLELERSELFLSAQWVVFPCDVVQL